MSPRHQTAPPTSDPARRDLGEHLRAHREDQGMSLEDVAHATRIPARSLRRLEAGRFDELPADVFVRGFLRSYARCVELDPEETVRRYAACGLEPAPVCTREAEELRRQARRAAGEPDEQDGPGSESPPERGTTSPTATNSGARRPRSRTFLPPDVSPSGGARRGQLTLGVIILVIVATLAMSYLMRRPSDAGDGVTEAERPLPAQVA